MREVDGGRKEGRMREGGLGREGRRGMVDGGRKGE